MKKPIQTGFALLLLLGSIHSFSQEKPVDQLRTARIQLLQGTSKYNPQAAFATFSQKAAEGNAQAMNALGMMYSNGMGIPVNETQAVEWFEKAGQNGYAQAYYNLALYYKEGIGIPKDPTKTLGYYQKAAQAGYITAYQRWGEMHKDGIGTPQDYTQAMTIFAEGAQNGSAGCLYAQGYLHYKGFGVPQDYSKAIDLFEQADAKNYAMGTYMLGYCYQNGYGVTMDAAKAKTLFEKAAKQGLKRAQEDLENPELENKQPNQLQTVSAPTTQELDTAPTQAPKKLQLVKQKLTKGDLSGNYTGTLLRYDWSGQNVLTTTPIEVSFDQNGKELTGNWLEQEGDSISFNASIQANEILFNNTQIGRAIDRQTSIDNFEFKNAKLQVVENQDDIYIVGNLQLYNTKERENEKPMYLILSRQNNQEPTQQAGEILVSKLVIYPNPVPTNSFKLSFDLAEQTPINIKIYDMMGLIKHQQNLTTTGTGLQEQNIDFNAPAGNYILNLYYNNQIVRTILIKQ
ncbi:T9SS type A sorting domain-containing protein [Flavobacterium faecale]|uniref:T9SS type A sorting domain-containing protein n=1 Tax=Flavobacterium faecale TaxID=1355330 RepID=UPI003AABC90B